MTHYFLALIVFLAQPNGKARLARVWTIKTWGHYCRVTAKVILVLTALSIGIISNVLAEPLVDTASPSPANSTNQALTSQQSSQAQVQTQVQTQVQSQSQGQNQSQNKSQTPIHSAIQNTNNNVSTKPKKSHQHHSALTPKSKIIRLARFGETEAVKALSERLAREQDLPKEWVTHQIANAQLIPAAVQLMMPAPAPVQKNWHAYRARFIEPKRIAQGVEFWQKNALTLAQAERDFGVAPEIIIGILGVETLYGQHMGAYPVLDSLATLALEFPKEHPRAGERQVFFQNELGFFLKQEFSRYADSKLDTKADAKSEAKADTKTLDRREVLGSYAGAIGAAQFMPSSLAKFAIDYDQDGRIDLIHSSKDAIGSVANYFKMFGWKSAEPTRFSVDLSSPKVDLEALLLPDILPTFSVQAFEEKGAFLSEEGKKHSGLLALIELQNGNDPKEYLAGTENFYVVTRYNWSSYYAMAVLDLGQAVKDAYAQKVALSK